MTEPTVLVGTWDDGLFAIAGDERTQEFANQPVRGLAPDGAGGALVIVGGHSLCRRAPRGNWTTLVTTALDLSCCMAVADTIYVGTDDARMLRLNSGVLEPLDGFNTVAGRETWFAGSAIINGQRLGPPLGIRSVAANADSSVLFANVHVGGIPRSTDGGNSWQPTIDINADVHEVRGHPTNPNIIVAASAKGLCISRDAGAMWTIDREGLHASYCSAVAFSGDDILVSASTDHFADQGKIYRRPVTQDARTIAIEGGLPAWFNGIVDTGCIATSGAMVAVVDRAGSLYLSTDFGLSWSRGSSAAPTPSSLLIC
jgi:hypothetical protein